MIKVFKVYFLSIVLFSVLSAFFINSNKPIFTRKCLASAEPVETLSSVEYKMLLKAEYFTDIEEGFEGFWKIVKKAGEKGGYIYRRKKFF